MGINGKQETGGIGPGQGRSTFTVPTNGYAFDSIYKTGWNAFNGGGVFRAPWNAFNGGGIYDGGRRPYGSSPPPPTPTANTKADRRDVRASDVAMPKNDVKEKQRALELGAPVHMVFCERVSGEGGVFISPPAAEARYESGANGAVVVRYRVVLSEGNIGVIQDSDLYQGDQRIGTSTHAFGSRPESWVPGNTLPAGNTAPTNCGSGTGTFGGLKVMAFTATHPAGDPRWAEQVHCFVREGRPVTRLLDNVTGASRHFPDLVKLVWTEGAGIPSALIDDSLMLTAAQFCNAEKMYFQGVLASPSNAVDYIQKVARYYLLSPTRKQGKLGLRPIIPGNSSGIITTAITPDYEFTELDIVPGSWRMQWLPRTDRKPFCAQMTWRIQPETSIGYDQTTEVRYSGEAANGPFEQHDMSEFCTTYRHSVLAGAFAVSYRRHVRHTLSIQVLPGTWQQTVGDGDIIQVTLPRDMNIGAAGEQSCMYWLTEMSSAANGNVNLQLTHFPVDSQKRSVIAREVRTLAGAP